MIKIATLVTSLLLTSAAMAQLSCSSAITGAGCGATLNINFTPQGGGGNQRIDLTATGLLPNVHGMMVWGYNPATIALPSGCTLFVDFAWGHNILTNAQGEFNWSRTWPASVTGQYHIQIGSFTFDANNNFVLAATDARLAQCL